MLIRKPAEFRYSDITPREQYLNRRRFLAAGSAALGSLALPFSALATMQLNGVTKSSFTVNEKLTSKEDITHYDNYYEFGTDKEEPAKNAGTLRASPWTVAWGGLGDTPRTSD